MLERLALSIHRYWFAFIAALPRLGLALPIVVGGILLSIRISGLFKRKIGNKAHDPLMGRFLGKAIKVGGIIAVCMIGSNAAGLSNMAGGLLAAAGASCPLSIF